MSTTLCCMYSNKCMCKCLLWKTLEEYWTVFIGHGTFIAARDYKWLGTVSRASSSERHILELYREVQHICIHVHVYTFTCVSVQLAPNGVLKNVHVYTCISCMLHACITCTMSCIHIVYDCVYTCTCTYTYFIDICP